MSTSFVRLVEGQFTIMFISLCRTVAALAGCGKTIVARWTSKGPRVWGKPGLSGYLVHLVSLVQPNKPDRPNKPTNGLLTLAGFFSILLDINGDTWP
jgi:hypothetical protein